MLRAASVLSLALVLVAPGLASAKQLTIKLKDPPLDTAVRASEELVLTLGIDVLMDGTLLGTMEAARTESTRKIESILHWDDEKRHVLVTVDSISERETTRSPSGNEDSAVESPLNGKSYFAEWTAARGLAFTSGSGGTLTKEESAALAELYDDLGSRQNRMGAALTGRRLTVGEPVELPPDAVAALLGGGDDFVIEEISLTLEGKVRVDGKPCAKFATEMVLSNDDGGMKMIIRLAGSFVIRLKDGMTLSFNFEGPLSATGTSNEPGSPPVQMNGGGTMKVSATYTEL